MKKQRNYIDIYTDYLISIQTKATATGLSDMLEGEISHDQITRFLSKELFDSKRLWKEVKGVVREIEDENGVLIFDDTIQEKKWTKENEIISWHYDHKIGSTLKGINILNCLYYSNGTSIPIAFEIIKKDIRYCDIESRKEKEKVIKNKK